MLRNLRRNLVLAVVLGVVVYAVLAVSTDVESLGDELRTFPWWALGAALGLAFSNYVIRFGKWEIYRRQLAISLGLGESFGIFLAGFVMSVTPAKVGEVLKSFLLKDRHGVPIATSAPNSTFTPSRWNRGSRPPITGARNRLKEVGRLGFEATGTG